MKGVAVGFVLASLGGGLAWGAPPDSTMAMTKVRNTIPATIDSEASFEYFIGMATRLAHDDTGKQLATLSAQLNALKLQKQSLLQKIGAVQAQAAPNATFQLQALRSQLARVELEIKDLLNQIARIREEEDRVKDDIQRSQDLLQRLLDSLANAERARTEMMGAVSMSTFARRLPAAKRREAEGKARTALTQLAEARRVRVSRASTIYEPAFHPAPKPLTFK